MCVFIQDKVTNTLYRHHFNMLHCFILTILSPVRHRRCLLQLLWTLVDLEAVCRRRGCDREGLDGCVAQSLAEAVRKVLRNGGEDGDWWDV